MVAVDAGLTVLRQEARLEADVDLRWRAQIPDSFDELITGSSELGKQGRAVGGYGFPGGLVFGNYRFIDALTVSRVSEGFVTGNADGE